VADLIPIADPGDERLADYAALTDATLRKRYEHRAGVLVAEGPQVVRELVRSPYPVRSLLLAEERVAAMADVLAHLADHEATVPAYVVSRALLQEVVRFPLHQGVLACGGRLPPLVAETVVAPARRLVVLEGLNDHENLGTLFRTVRGLGGDGVVLGPGCADPLYRRSVRVSMGHVLQVPFARVATTAAVLDLLRAAGFTTLALTPGPEAVDLRDLGVAPDACLALLLGAEGPGLSEVARSGADIRVRIAMHAGVDSLNVAAAGAIALHALGASRSGG
jgi:tRNA G18 (ribose-2'-O)-methylase SpoU